MVKKNNIALAADANDEEDFDISSEALERGQKARCVRMARHSLGISQAEFSKRFRVPIGTLRDWEQARVTPPDFAVAYVKVIQQAPDLVGKVVAA